MSLLSIIRNGVPLITTRTTTLSVLFSRTPKPLLLPQQRFIWQEVVRQIPSDDPSKAGQMVFEDVDLADMRMGRATRAEGRFCLVLS